MTPLNERVKLKLWEKVLYFFPIQLVLVHLKKNLILIGFWLILFSAITGMIGAKYGIPYLFWYPEYLGKVDWLAHVWIGFFTGTFIMAFNISSYIINGFRFPFLATLNRPFLKYCQNNATLPLLFVGMFIFQSVNFQLVQEKISASMVLLNMMGYLLGNAGFIFITIIYFVFTNKNILYYRKPEQPEETDFVNPVKDLFSPKRKWKKLTNDRREWRVSHYIGSRGKLMPARTSGHYKPETLNKVFDQNSINATVFQLGVIAFVFMIGWFDELPFLNIPAGASILLFFTLLIMLSSAYYTWLKGWAMMGMIGTIVLIGVIGKTGAFRSVCHAYGLDYSSKSPYSIERLWEIQNNPQDIYLDYQVGLRTLENWKKKSGSDKPVAVFINVPGGGLRSALWAAKSLSHVNELTNEALWNDCVLISGSSGGMIGASYLREYYLRESLDQVTIPIDSLLDDLGRDKLNAVASTAVMSDLLFRFKTFEYGEHRYTKDRALAFERTLNGHTRGWLNKPVSAYAALEQSATIPQLFLSPTISNDGRKLFISAAPAAHLTSMTNKETISEYVDAHYLLEENGIEDLSFLSALRMNATFPYIFPPSRLPTEPELKILDAGVRDNLGVDNTINYIYVYQSWLEANTSGILFIDIKDRKDAKPIEKAPDYGILEAIIHPVSSIYKTLLDVQEYRQNEALYHLVNNYEGDIEIVNLILNRDTDTPISLSWHLTQNEKEQILNSISLPENRRACERIRKVLGGA